MLVADTEVWVVFGCLEAGEVEALCGGGCVVDELCGRGERFVGVVFVAVSVSEMVQSVLYLFPCGLHRERVVDVLCSAATTGQI